MIILMFAVFFSFYRFVSAILNSSTDSTGDPTCAGSIGHLEMERVIEKSETLQLREDMSNVSTLTYWQVRFIFKYLCWSILFLSYFLEDSFLSFLLFIYLFVYLLIYLIVSLYIIYLSIYVFIYFFVYCYDNLFNYLFIYSFS